MAIGQGWVMGASRGDHDGAVIAASLVDPTGFEAVFDRHFDAIHRYLAIRVGGDAADDLAATVFVEAFAARARFDVTRADAAPWLYGIATNLVRRQRRQERRALRALTRAAHQTAAAADDAADGDRLHDRLAALGRRPDLGRALGDLRPAERDAVLLAACTDLTYDEIAAALDVPVGTVRSTTAVAKSETATVDESTTAPIARPC
jgi:RNA polymerase sigma-70 factor (ECF subfamily)